MEDQRCSARVSKFRVSLDARMEVAHPAGRYRYSTLVLLDPLLDPSVAERALAKIRANVDDRTLSEPICDRPPLMVNGWAQEERFDNHLLFQRR